VQEETPRKVVPHIGKIRHLINAKVKPRNWSILSSSSW
jgi:hypothetical protein